MGINVLLLSARQSVIFSIIVVINLERKIIYSPSLIMRCEVLF